VIDLVRDRALGREASDLLNSKMFSDVMDSYEKALVEQWKLSPARDTEGREKLWLAVQALHGVRNALAAMIEDGKIAEIELKKLGEERG
jgi:hypothetical protein